MASPHDRLIEMGDWIMVSWALQVAATLGVADAMADGADDPHTIAAEVDADPDALIRVLRLLAAHGVVAERRTGTFELTGMGECLRSDVPGSLRSWFVMNEPVYRALMGAPLESVRSGRPVFEQVIGSTFFEYGATDPSWGQAFDDAMGAVGRQTASAVVDAYDFDGMERLVDVGGGSGTLLTTILEAYPRLRGVLVDLPHVLDRAATSIRASGSSDRIDLVACDFFEGTLPPGDGYVLSWIIHDWGDEDARRILENVRAAIRPGGRLLLIEAVIPPGDQPHFSKTLDIVMLVALGGRERTEPAYRAVLAAARFELVAIHPTSTPMSVLEARPI